MGESQKSSSRGVVIFIIVVLSALGIWFFYIKGAKVLDVSSSKDDLVCSNAIEWPNELKKSDPLTRMKSYCKGGVFDLNWDRSSSNCTAYLSASASLKCSEATFKRRRQAARAEKLAAVREWEAEVKREVLNNPALEIESEGSDVELLKTIGARIADTREKPLYKGDFEFYLYEASGELDDLNNNAFAIPGGAIFMGRVLFRSLDEAEAAFVLGHEIAHVEWFSFSGAILRLVNESLLSKLKGVLLSLCEGPMDEVVADRYALRYMAQAGYDVSAPARLFWRPLRDGLDLKDYSMFVSHPPSTMRASYVYLEARKHLSPPRPMYRGSADQTGVWDGSFSDEDRARCRYQND
jgi:hypothetical protein